MSEYYGDDEPLDAAGQYRVYEVQIAALTRRIIELEDELAAANAVLASGNDSFVEQLQQFADWHEADKARITVLEASNGLCAQNNELLRSKLLEFPDAADAEMGALARRWRDHPERRAGYIEASELHVEHLTERLAALDVAEAYVHGKGLSGTRYRIRGGEIDWWFDGLETGEMSQWIVAKNIAVEDLPVVNAMLGMAGGRQGRNDG